MFMKGTPIQMKLRLLYMSVIALVAFGLILLGTFTLSSRRASEQSALPSGCVALDYQSEPWPELEIRSEELSAIRVSYLKFLVFWKRGNRKLIAYHLAGLRPG